MTKREAADIDRILAEALTAGMAAANAHTPTPMIVEQRANPLNDASPVERSYHVPSGVCGFAWVSVKPGTGKFAKRMLALGIARRDGYYGGVTRWVSEFGQSMERKEAFAHAFARVLSDNGVKAYAMSRMD